MLTATLVGLALVLAPTLATAQGNGVERGFRARDTNRDGRVSLDEFRAFMLARLARMDQDDNGGVSRNEFLAHYTAGGRRELGPKAMTRLERRFDWFDTGEDGTIAAAEYGGRADEIFVQIDGDADGHLSLEEMRATAR